MAEKQSTDLSCAQVPGAPSPDPCLWDAPPLCSALPEHHEQSSAAEPLTQEGHPGVLGQLLASPFGEDVCAFLREEEE